MFIPDSRNSKQARRLILLALVVPCLLVSVPAIVGFRAERQLADSVHWVSHTIEVQGQFRAVLVSILNAETGQRGFLLTGRRLYLGPYQSALRQLPVQVATVRRLTADNAAQQENLRQLEPLIAERLDLIAQTVSLQERGEHDGAMALINTDRGQQAMDAIRNRLDLMEREESHLLMARQRLLASTTQLSSYVLVGLIGLDLLFAAAMLALLRRLAKVHSIVTMCAWSHTVEYEGEWLSFEQYLRRRFDVDTSHGISPAEAEKVFGPPRNKRGSEAGV